MPINNNLLIAAPMLQDYLVDKDGTPMSGGTITCYHDNSRTTLKNWYYQSGTPGNYTYIPLPNPLTLSAAGTICDINGVDTIPFFYPYSEINDTVFDPYYITIVNHAQTNQITRANFPFVGNVNNNPTEITQSLNNLIINNGFWRNIVPNNITSTPYKSLNLSTDTAKIVAPSQHDGFQYPDILFAKNNTSATEAVTFVPFPVSNSLVISTPTKFTTPEYYLSHNCSGAGAAEQYKYYQFPICLHLNNLANVPFTFSIQAQNGSATPAVISIFIFQDTGTGTSPPAAANIGNITLNSTWQNYTITNIFNSAVGLSLSNASDDAFYLRIGMPLNTTCTVNFTKPSIYLTNDVIPANDFQTYDQVDAIINSPRTGDIRTSINRFYPYGWVPMNDGTIGNSNSNASAYGQQDAWPLFNLLWGLFSNYDNAGTNLIAQMYTSAGATVAYGASALADWNANRAIALTKMMGKVILGTSTILSGGYETTFTSNANLITTLNTMSFFNGMPVYFSGTSVLSTKLIYYVTNFNGTNQFNLASSFANAMAGTTLVFANDSGTIFSALQGTSEGEYAHTQLLTELVGHTHTVNVTTLSGGGIQTINTTQNANGNLVPYTTSSTGGGAAFNVTQPGTFYNMFIKL